MEWGVQGNAGFAADVMLLNDKPPPKIVSVLYQTVGCNCGHTVRGEKHQVA